MDKAIDPVVDHFLEILARDMCKHSGSAIVSLPTSLRDRVNAFVGHIDIDLDAKIDGEVVL